MQEIEITRAIDEMAAKWPSNIVSRKAVREFTGGVITGKSLANEDSKGTGPEKFILLNQVVYPVQEFCDWLKSRAVTKSDVCPARRKRS
jgi:hypothetical protein